MSASRAKRGRRRALALALPLLLAAPACQNFGVVEEDKLYRSAQLDPEDLREVAEERRIKTVVNLRGEKEEKDWYAGEAEVCAELGIAHRSVRLSARRWPEPHEVLALLEIFETSEYPMIVHCAGGADRSGLASAVYRLEMRREPASLAAKELTVWHGHLGALNGTGELDEFIALYERTGAGKPFRRWLEHDYVRERDRLLDPGRALRARPPALPPLPADAGAAIPEAADGSP